MSNDCRVDDCNGVCGVMHEQFDNIRSLDKNHVMV